MRQQLVIPDGQLAQNIRKQTHDQTIHRQATLSRAHRLDKDVDRQKRLEELLCPCCYYAAPIIAGCMITVSNCRACNTETQFGSTHIDQFCRGCSKKHSMCRLCGADLNLQQRKE